MAVISFIRTKLRKLPTFIKYHKIPVTPSGLQMAFNDARIARLKDRHVGRRCFIIGNGPSLKTGDLDRLKGELTFGCNKIYLAFARTEWRPTYLAVADELVALNNRRELRSLKLDKLYSWEAADILLPDRRATVIYLLPHPRDEQGEQTLGFSSDMMKGSHGGYTILYFCLQMAVYMGVREIYLIGLDFSFTLSPSTGESLPISGEVLVSLGERNHFHPDYRKPGETWTRPDLEAQRRAFQMARESIEGIGGRVLNASRETKLDVLERVAFDDLFD